ncbi:MAG: ribose 5-phosphate isomerase B [Nitrospirota bacterium]|nr:ribose 5-phosphate isomerase B [Nitrospirota bacterium]
MSSEQPILIASDHAGVGLKAKIARFIREELGQPVEDRGAFTDESVDYPDYGMLVAGAVSTGTAPCGVLICGTGIGMSIIANKFPGVRAALCHNEMTARMSRQHNDANILVIGERVVDEATALNIVRAWFATGFEGGRHQRRIDKIHDLETK